MFIKLDVTLWRVIEAKLDLGIRVGIGEVVFRNILVIRSTRNLFLKNPIVYFFGSKLTSFLLFSFLIHSVVPCLSFTSIRLIQNIVGIASTAGVATYCGVLQNIALPI